MLCMRCGKNFRDHIQNRFCYDEEGNEIYITFAYVNVYEVYQCRGGREEGGWYYNAGEPVESIKVSSAEEFDLTWDRLHVKYELDKNGDYIGDDVMLRRGSTSAAGGYDIVITKEYRFAEPFPTAKPTWE